MTRPITTGNATMGQGQGAPQKDRRRARRWTQLLLAGWLLTAASTEAQARCYTPSDQTVGWKRAAIPDEAPGLSVADPQPTPWQFIEQFRADEQAVVWLGTDRGSMALSGHHPGRIEYMFRIDGAQWQILQVQVAAGLAGEKIDVIAYTPSGPVPIWLERRVSGTDFTVDWALDGVYAVAVSFHHHLRERPVVTAWQAGLRTRVSAASWLPAAFRQPRSLYYYHPGGRTILLCDERYQELAVHRQSLIAATPTAVRLVPR